MTDTKHTPSEAARYAYQSHSGFNKTSLWDCVAQAAIDSDPVRRELLEALKWLVKDIERNGEEVPVYATEAIAKASPTQSERK